jgi:DUF1680 family protein
VDTRRSPLARLRPVPISAVQIEDDFWAPRLRTTREATLAHVYRQCEETGRLDNFRRAAGRTELAWRGSIASDTHVYKWLEGASLALAAAPDVALEGLVDRVIADVAAAQSPDGYLDTYFTFERRAERYADLTTRHELYCAGHLIQAAVAHHRATGKRALLDVAVRAAEHLCRTFGPGARGGTDGHPEVEMALVELYRELARPAYLR